MKIIGFTGKACSGKSTAAKLAKELLEAQGKTVLVHNFADELKAAAKRFGWDGKKDAKGRRFLQLLGTEIGRAYNPDHWVEQWHYQVQHRSVYSNEGEADWLLVEDVRFANEVAEIRRLGGVVVAVQVYEAFRQTRAHLAEVDLGSGHASEQFLVADRVLYNDAGLVELRAEVARMLVWADKNAEEAVLGS